MGHLTTSQAGIAAYGRAIWRFVGAMGALTVVSFLITGVRADLLSRPILWLPFAVLCVTRGIYTFVRPDTRLQTFGDTSLQLLLILFFGTLLSYAAATSPMPLQDDALYAIDQALGFDRRAYIDFFTKRPWLFAPIESAYSTLMPQFVVVLLMLFAVNQPQRLQQFTLATGAALLATDAISALVPALSTIYIDLGLPAHAPLPPDVHWYIPTLEKLRSGAQFLIQLDVTEGLISFPSFHTIGALFFIWALWTVSYVRWIVLAVNVGVIAATPIVGRHYIIDLAGGAVVALAAIAAAGWLRRAAEASDRVTASHAQEADIAAFNSQPAAAGALLQAIPEPTRNSEAR